MKHLIKLLLKKTVFFPIIDYILWKFRCDRTIKNRDRIIDNWVGMSRPIPPPNAKKQATVVHYSRKYALNTFIETGTFRGDMIYAMRNEFSKIYSIELYDILFKRSRKIFSKYPHVKLIHGNSADKLEEILGELCNPSLFWLDAHYSGEGTAIADSNTPILSELQQIVKHPIQNHVILIDDAREFEKHTKGYPSIGDLEKIVQQRSDRYTFDVEDDIIRICTF